MRLFTFVAVLFCGLVASAQTVDDFVFNADISANTFNSAFGSMVINGTGSILIDWGDGQMTTYIDPVDQSLFHSYPANILYTIRISGSLDSFVMNQNDRPIDVIQWGTSNWKSLNNAFSNCSQVTINTSDTPDFTQLTNMSRMFYRARNFNANMSNWDVSNVTDMSFMFYQADNFNSDISSWSVSNVSNMSSMFVDNFIFNVDISSWNVANVTDMSTMFLNASIFNQSIGSWNVSNVVDMQGMFRRAYAFNSDISSWNVSNVTNMSSMFQQTTVFNSDISTWDVSSVTDMSYMFEDSMVFNSDISNWDVSSVGGAVFITRGSMSRMFYNAIAFNQNLSSWNFNISNDPSFFDLAFDNSNLSTDNYDALLDNFVNLNLSSQLLGAQGLKFCDSFSRSILISNGWNITGDTQSSNCSDSTLTGTITYDLNNDGCDATDLKVNNLAVVISDGTNSLNVYTLNGQYDIDLPDGTYTITPDINNALFTATPINANVTLSNAATVTQDFCLTATAPVDDLEVTILSIEDARPGFDTNYKLIYKNKGNTQLSGSVNFNYQDDFMDFLTASPAITSSNVGMLSWVFSNLDPFETREIEFSMNLNTPTDTSFPLASGDLLDFSATINPTTNDDTPLDNVFDLQQTVVNSYDPNDKTCLQGETILPTMVGEFVHYRIRFENEGTASAVNVKIVDYIDTTKFDITTLTPLSGSHDYTTTITDGNKVEFKFDNIMLPFTAPASQGYVLFKIKTVDTLVLGDDFSNQAEIYFDFNFPIITNLETTGVAVPLSLNDNNLLQVSLYPNPTKNKISLTSNIEFNQYTIYDTLGAIVFQEKLDAAIMNKDITLDHLVSGLYFVEVKGDQMNSVLKLIKK